VSAPAGAEGSSHVRGLSSVRLTPSCCGAALNGSVLCWDLANSSLRITTVATGSFAIVTTCTFGADDSAVCALDRAGMPTCWNLDAAHSALVVPTVFTAAGPFSDLSCSVAGGMDGVHICGLSATGQLHCFAPRGAIAWQTDGPYGRDVTAACAVAGLVCGLAGGNLTCWGPRNASVGTAPQEAYTNFVEIGCSVRARWTQPSAPMSVRTGWPRTRETACARCRTRRGP
jgi:hypothetical protein